MPARASERESDTTNKIIQTSEHYLLQLLLDIARRVRLRRRLLSGVGEVRFQLLVGGFDLVELGRGVSLQGFRV